MKDPIGNLLTSIRNAQMRKKEFVDVVYSTFKEEIVKILIAEGFALSFEALSKGNKKVLRIFLKYSLNRFGKLDQPAISEIKLISKPGKRNYVSCQEIPVVMSGFGISIISTPKGVMSGRDAKKNKVGGEVVAHVY